jgi:D-aspartate ligase
MHKAVVLGSNYYIALSVFRSLKAHGVATVAADYDFNTCYAHVSKACDEKILVRDYKIDEEGFIDDLVSYASKQMLKPVLFPCADPYVELIDAHYARLSQVFLLTYRTPGLATKVLDKSSVDALALKHNLKIPVTFHQDDEDLLSRVAKVGYPFVMKGAISSEFVKNFRVKLFVIHNDQELISYLKLAKEKNVDVIIQQMIPGFDDHMYTYDAYVDKDGKVVAATSCQKLRQYPINYGASVYTKHFVVSQLHEIGAPFLSAIGWSGFAEIEFKKHSQTGEFYMIEVNVRTTNLNELLRKVGINFPYMAYAEAIGLPLEESFITETQPYVFWYMYEDGLAILNYIKTKQLTLNDVLKTWNLKKVESIFSWKDLRPFFRFLRLLNRKIFKSLKRRFFK